MIFNADLDISNNNNFVAFIQVCYLFLLSYFLFIEK